MTKPNLPDGLNLTEKEFKRLMRFAGEHNLTIRGNSTTFVILDSLDNWWAFLLLAKWRGDSLEKLMTPPPAVDSTTDRLARACAHGCRQKELVNELLMGPVKVVKFIIPGGLGMQSVLYGNAGVDPRSFQNLRRRLSTNGFFFVRSKDGTTIEMKFSR